MSWAGRRLGRPAGSPWSSKWSSFGCAKRQVLARFYKGFSYFRCPRSIFRRAARVKTLYFHKVFIRISYILSVPEWIFGALRAQNIKNSQGFIRVLLNSMPPLGYFFPGWAGPGQPGSGPAGAEIQGFFFFAQFKLFSSFERYKTLQHFERGKMFQDPCISIELRW